MSKMQAQLRMQETQILRSQTGPSTQAPSVGQSSPSGAERVGRRPQTDEAIPKTGRLVQTTYFSGPWFLHLQNKDKVPPQWVFMKIKY